MREAIGFGVTLIRTCAAMAFAAPAYVLLRVAIAVGPNRDAAVEYKFVAPSRTPWCPRCSGDMEESHATSCPWYNSCSDCGAPGGRHRAHICADR